MGLISASSPNTHADTGQAPPSWSALQVLIYGAVQASGPLHMLFPLAAEPFPPHPPTNPTCPLQLNTRVTSSMKPTLVVHGQNQPSCPPPYYSCTLCGLFQKVREWGDHEHWTWSWGDLVSSPECHFLIWSPWAPFLASVSLPVKSGTYNSAHLLVMNI